MLKVITPNIKEIKTIIKLLQTITDIGLISIPIFLINISIIMPPLSMQKVEIKAVKLYSTIKNKEKTEINIGINYFFVKMSF